MSATTLSLGGLIMLDNDLSSYNGHHRMDRYQLVEGDGSPLTGTFRPGAPVVEIKEWLRPRTINKDDIARWSGKPALKILFIQTHNNFSASPDKNPRHRTIPCRSEVVPLPERETQRSDIKEIFEHARLPLAALGAYLKSHITFLDDSPYQIIGEEGANGGDVTSFYVSGTSWSVAWSYFHTTGHTSAVVFHREGDGDIRRTELEAEILRQKNHISHPLLLAFIKTTISLQWTFQLLDEMNWETREIEKTLGLPAWDWVLDRVIEAGGYSSDIKDDAEMIAEAQEAAVAKFHILKGKLTNIIFRLRAFKDQIGWVQRVNSSYAADLHDERYELECKQLDQRLYQMADFNSVYLSDAETLSHRLDSQMTIMSHQVAQRDARIGLTIAWQGRSSNSAMIALTIAAFIFVPWTFIAQLFGTPIFQWRPKGDEVVVMQPFRTYWITCGIVTGVIGLVWVVWWVLRRQNEEKRKREKRYLFESLLSTSTKPGLDLGLEVRRVASKVSVKAEDWRGRRLRSSWLRGDKSRVVDEEMEMV